jgi:hypothetical protein
MLVSMGREWFVYRRATPVFSATFADASQQKNIEVADGLTSLNA